MAVTHRIPGLVMTEHELSLPLDHDRPDGEQITVFAREVADPDGADRPFLLFLHGGPGMEAPRPSRYPTSPGWLDRALQEFRVLMLDQRGTGRSSPVSAAALADRTPAEQASYLEHPIGRHPDEIYQATYARVLERNRRYYDRYPEDRKRFLAARDTAPVLASGDRLSHARLRQIGSLLGASDGAERVHAILELSPRSPAFAHDVEAIGFARNPIYAILHESSYADGHVTGWSALRTMPAVYAEDPTLMTGEHVYPWMFEQMNTLAPLREAAELLAQHEWPRLYDREMLADNEVPAAAAIYTDDMYIERTFSEETAAHVRGLRPWVTSEYEHNGLRADGGRILERLIDLVRGRR